MSKKYITILFMEGFLAIFAQIFCGMLLSFLYGNSIVIWTFVLGIGMLSLALGYFISQYISNIVIHKTPVYIYIFFFTLVYTLIIPSIFNIVSTKLLDVEIIIGTIVISLVTFCPLLILLGTIPTGISTYLSSISKNEGNKSGNAFFISTIGGIVGSLLSALFLIPTFGIKNSILIVISLFLIILIGILIKRKEFNWKLIAFISITFFFFIVNSAFESSTIKKHSKSKSMKILYEEFGIMGHLVVVEPIGGDYRAISVNNIVQSVINKYNYKSFFGYVQRIATFSSGYPKNSKVLVIGLGGAALINEYEKLGFDVTVCELDNRIINVAKKYFGLSNNVKCVIDDARHYLNISKQKYDIIVMDVSWAENQPSHLYTVENFSQIKNLLNNNGVFYLHYQGNLIGENLSILNSINNTLDLAGFSTKLLDSAPPDIVAEKIFISHLDSNNKIIVSDFRLQEYLPDFKELIINNEPKYIALDYSKSEIFTDNAPKLDILEKNTTILKRKNSLSYVKGLLIQGYFVK
jgi:spermidine synthase